MKKLFFPVLFFALFSIFASAQSGFYLMENEPALVYSLPKTELCIEVEIEKTTQQPGEFYRYSERYLATKDVITEQKNTFRLKDVRVNRRAIPDIERTFSINPNNKKGITNISVNEKGLLCGVNVDCKEIAYYTESQTNQTTSKSNSLSTLPLPEEYMIAGSTAKMAEGAAKQIYRIRENRVNLLLGDVDHLPADGESFKTMLEGMDKLEKELTELFTGSVKSETQTYVIYLTPSSAMNNEVLFRVSAMSGLVSSDDLSGTPYYIDITPSQNATVQNPRGKGTSMADQLFTINPTPTQVKIGDGKRTFYSEQIFMPQFGSLIPVSENILKVKDVKIHIDQETGRLLKID